MITCYTDGSVTNNGLKDSYGSCAFIAMNDRGIFYEDAVFDTGCTNNQMELTAIIKALEFLQASGYVKERIVIYCDSQYCINGINSWMQKWKTNNWRRGVDSEVSVKNADLWRCIYNLTGLFPALTLQWVRGHSGNEWNEYVDGLCTSAIEKEGGVSFESLKYK